MAILTAYKGVTAGGISAGRELKQGGGVAFTDDEWAILQRNYGLGLVVEPDPDELAVKLGNRLTAERAAESAGLYAFTFRSGQWITAETAACSGVPFGGGHRVELEFDTGDVIASVIDGGRGCSEVQLASATVVGIRSPSLAAVNDSTIFHLQVAIGDADGAVTYEAVDSDSNVIDSDTATNAAGTGHYTATFTTPVSPTQLTITWEGDWSAGARTFRTYALVR